MSEGLPVYLFEYTIDTWKTFLHFKLLANSPSNKEIIYLKQINKEANKNN